MQVTSYINLEKQYGVNNYKPLDVMRKHLELPTWTNKRYDFILKPASLIPDYAMIVGESIR